MAFTVASPRSVGTLFVAALVVVLGSSLAVAGPALARQVPAARCAALGRVPDRPAAWVDDHDESSPLVTNLARLICSAADGATIDIKSWFILVDDPIMRALADDLALMHRVHDVHVNVLVGREIYRTHHWSWPTFRRAFAFADVRSCWRECGVNTAGTVPHGKWVTVSRLRQGGPAVLSMSANWTREQFRSAQSGIFVPHDLRVYRAFLARWQELQRCSNGRSCTPPAVRPRWHQGRGSTAVYFSPVPVDLVAATLSSVDCHAGGVVEVLSMFFHRRPVEQQLDRLVTEGCRVRLVLEHTPSERLAAKYPLRCLHEHDKVLVIDTPGRRQVIAGAEALTTHAGSVNENQMVRTRVGSVVTTYRAYVDRQWRRAHICTPRP